MDKKHRRTNFKNKLGTGLYTKCYYKKYFIPFKSLGRNILELLQETIVNNYEQSCIKEGILKQIQ